MAVRDWSKLGWAVVWLGWALLLGWRGFEQWSNHAELSRDGATVEGIVTYSEPPTGGEDGEPPITNYQFRVGDVTYEGGALIYVRKGETIVVRYLPSDPAINEPDGYGGDYVHTGLFTLIMVWLSYHVGSCGYSQKTLRRVADNHGSITPAAFERLPIVVFSMASATMLYLAQGQHPYVFFQILRWLVTGTAGLLCYYALTWQFRWAPYLYGAIAILFNPVVPFHMARRTWAVIDLIAAIIFVASAFLVKPAQTEA